MKKESYYLHSSHLFIGQDYHVHKVKGVIPALDTCVIDVLVAHPFLLLSPT
jgi:hypothetical protein